MPVLVRLLAHIPLRFMHVLGALLGWLAFLASPTYRRRFLANAARAGYRFAEVRAAVTQAGRTVAEIPRLWFGAVPDCALVNEGLVAEAYAAGRGVIYLSPHLGGFELCAQDAARRWGDLYGPITVLYRPARQAWLARMMETARNRPAMQAVPTTLAGSPYRSPWHAPTGQNGTVRARWRRAHQKREQKASRCDRNPCQRAGTAGRPCADSTESASHRPCG